MHPELFNSFITACRAYFSGDRPLSIPELKELTTQDKIELSKMLNDAGYQHPKYTLPSVESIL